VGDSVKHLGAKVKRMALGPRMVFARQRLRWPWVAAALFVVMGAPTAFFLTRPAPIDLRGTFTMFQPLRCHDRRPGDIFHTRLVFVDKDGNVVGRAAPWRGVRLVTEEVRGYAHCREVGSYVVRLPREDSYRIAIPALGEELRLVSFDQLEARRFRYDVFYCCGP
jgi:hypothetical protein